MRQVLTWHVPAPLLPAGEASRQDEARYAVRGRARLFQRKVVPGRRDDLEAGPRYPSREGAHGLRTQQEVILAREDEARSLDAVKLATRVVKEAGERVPEQGYPRRGVGVEHSVRMVRESAASETRV